MRDREYSEHEVVSHLAYGTVVTEVTSVLALPDALLWPGGADLAEGTVAV